MRIRIKNRLSDIESVNSALGDFAAEHNIPVSVVTKCKILFDELINNIVSYAYRDTDDHVIEIKLELEDNGLHATVTDDGVSFNPLKTETPDLGASLEDRRIGGLGIHLVKNFADHVAYQRRGEKNVVTLVINVGSVSSK